MSEQTNKENVLVTFYKNVWKDDELFECTPVHMIAVPKEVYRGTGTLCTARFPRRKRVSRRGDDGFMRHTYEKTGVVDALEVSLLTTRKVKDPEPGYVYCEYRLR